MSEKLKSEMTLREHYAGLAMQALLPKSEIYLNQTMEFAVESADALITELNKKEFQEARDLLLQETELKRLGMEKNPRWVEMTSKEIEESLKEQK